MSIIVRPSQRLLAGAGHKESYHPLWEDEETGHLVLVVDSGSAHLDLLAESQQVVAVLDEQVVVNVAFETDGVEEPVVRQLVVWNEDDVLEVLPVRWYEKLLPVTD